MSASKFNGKVILSSTNLTDISPTPGSKLKWAASFSFSDSSGVYVGSSVSVGAAIVLDTSASELGTITSYVVTKVVSSTFNSFRVEMEYIASNGNPSGPPDISLASNLDGYVGSRSTNRGLVSLTVPTQQRVPEILTYQVLNDNLFNILDSTTATSLSGGTAGQIHYQSAPNVSAFTAVGTIGQVLTSTGTGIPTWTTLPTTIATATLATNLVGAQWAIPYQSATNVTAMLPAGAAGQLLISNGAAAPSWLSTGIAGQVLTSNGAAAPSWQALVAVTQPIGTANTSIATTAFADRLRSSQLTVPTAGNTASLADRGNTISITAALTIPANVFASGDVFSVYNNTGGNLTLTSGPNLTLWLTGTSTTGSRTLAQRGIATVYYISAIEAVITGGGLS